MSKEIEKLNKRIEELEAELTAREHDLNRYKSELVDANRRLESMIGQLRTEIRLAHQIQKRLVPTELPNIAGFDFSSKFLPSLISGGDYYDIFEHEDKMQFGLLMSSCSGYALSALMMSVLLKLSRTMVSKKGGKPEVVLKNIASELKNDLGEVGEADVFCARVDRRKFELSYALFGKVVAIYQAYSRSELKMLGQTPSLKAGVELEIQTGSVSLNPRDRIIIATRGLIDSESLDKERYGLERFGQSILEGPKQGVHDLRNHLLYEVERHCSGQELKRDQTLLVMEIKDRVIKLAKD